MRCRHVVSAAATESTDEIALLEKALLLAKTRQARAKEQAEAAPSSNGTDYKGKGFTIQTFNAISPVGLKRFPKVGVSSTKKICPAGRFSA